MFYNINGTARLFATSCFKCFLITPWPFYLSEETKLDARIIKNSSGVSILKCCQSTHMAKTWKTVTWSNGRLTWVFLFSFYLCVVTHETCAMHDILRQVWTFNEVRLNSNLANLLVYLVMIDWRTDAYMTSPLWRF